MRYPRWLTGTLAGVAALVPGPVSPLPKKREDATPPAAEQAEMAEPGVLDEEYELEPFYQGLPIFNADGTRAPHLMPGADYRMTQIDVGGNPVACWRAAGKEWDSRTGLNNPEAMKAAREKALGAGTPVQDKGPDGRPRGHQPG